MKLSKTTLDYNSEKIFIPYYKFTNIDNGLGSCYTKVEKLK